MPLSYSSTADRVASEAQAELERQHLRGARRNALRRQQPALNAISLVKDKTWTWLRTPRLARASGKNFVAPGQTANQSEVVHAAFEGWSKQIELPNRGGLMPSIITLPQAVIDQLFRDTNKISLCSLLAKKGITNQLVRLNKEFFGRWKASELLAEDGEAEEVTPSVDPTTGTTPGDDTSTAGAPSIDVPDVDPVASPISVEDAQQKLRQHILGQVKELPELKNLGTTDDKKSLVEELQKIKDTVNNLELSGGPANATAFHDFQTLQIAFEDTWTAAFDNQLEAQVLDLYRQTVLLHEEYGI